MNISTSFKKTITTLLMCASLAPLATAATPINDIEPVRHIKLAYNMADNENEVYNKLVSEASRTNDYVALRSGVYVNVVETPTVHSRATIVYDKSVNHFTATVNYYNELNSDEIINTFHIEGDVSINHNAMKFVSVVTGEKLLPENKTLIIASVNNNLVITGLSGNDSTTYHEIK